MIDANAYRSAMSRFCSGVTVITARHAGGVRGMTATAFTSVSLHPPIVLICVSAHSRMHVVLQASEHFGVSILREDQAELAAHFAGRGVARSVRFESFGDGSVIAGALAHVVCEIATTHVEGDHMLYLGRVTACRTSTGRPLLYYAGDYGRLCTTRDALEAPTA